MERHWSGVRAASSGNRGGKEQLRGAGAPAGPLATLALNLHFTVDFQN